MVWKCKEGRLKMTKKVVHLQKKREDRKKKREDKKR